MIYNTVKVKLAAYACRASFCLATWQVLHDSMYDTPMPLDPYTRHATWPDSPMTSSMIRWWHFIKQTEHRTLMDSYCLCELNWQCWRRFTYNDTHRFDYMKTMTVENDIREFLSTITIRVSALPGCVTFWYLFVLPISVAIISLALVQTSYCPSASQVNREHMRKYIYI